MNVHIIYQEKIMGNFNRDNNYDRSRGHRDSGRSRFGGRGAGGGQMHDAVCDECGNDCQVPFMPTNGKPVYCSDCFEKRGNGRSEDRRSDFSPRKSFAPQTQNAVDYSRQLNDIAYKLDQILKALSPVEKISNQKIEASDTKSAKVEKVAKPKKSKAKKAAKSTDKAKE